MGILALGLFEQDARAQSLEDRPVGIVLGFDAANLANPGPTGGRLSMWGGDFAIYVKQNRWLRWRADACVGGGILGPGYDYELGGPEFTVHAGPAVFFAHALFGRGSVEGGSLDTSQTGFAMAYGGGVDLRVTSWFGLRLIDADYLPSHLTGQPALSLFGEPPAPRVTVWANNARLTFGLIFKVGRKS